MNQALESCLRMAEQKIILAGEKIVQECEPSPEVEAMLLLKDAIAYTLSAVVATEIEKP